MKSLIRSWRKVKFNGDRIQFKVSTVKNMGHIITPDGLRPDEAKVKLIMEMPPPDGIPIIALL